MKRGLLGHYGGKGRLHDCHFNMACLDSAQLISFTISGSTLLPLEPHNLRYVSALGKSYIDTDEYDAKDSVCLQDYRKGNISSVSYSPDGSRIVSGSRGGVFGVKGDNTIRVWDSKSGECLLVLKGHEGDVSSVSYSPDGGRIVSGSHDDTIRIWDSKSGECLLVLKGHEGDVSSVSYSPDGSPNSKWVTR